MIMMTPTTVLRFFLVGMLLFHANNNNGVVEAEIVTTEKSLKIKEGKGRFNYYYDDTTMTCKTIFFLGAGTAMRADSYQNISTEIVNAVKGEGEDTDNAGIIVIVVDDHPGFITKQNPKKYAAIVNEIAQNLSTYIPVCRGAGSGGSSLEEIDILIGGHSASGEGSIKALLQDRFVAFKPVGYVGLSPFMPFMVPKGTIDIPSLMWGFSRTSCMVVKDWAALRGYKISNPTQRVFYQYQTDNLNSLSGGPHCSYTDHGCPAWNNFKWLKACHGTQEQSDTIPSAVAASINVFLKQIKGNNNNNGSFLSEPFEAIKIEGAKLYVNEQTVPK